MPSTGDNTLHIRVGRPQDIPAILVLIKELAEYEKSLEAVQMTEKQLLIDGFGDVPSFRCFVAEREGEILGTAIYYYCFSTWRGKYIHLEDLIVSDAARGQGVGGALFQRMIDQCKKEGLAQLGWEVLDWNEPAINFYKKYAAHLDSEWINGRIYFE